MSYLKEVIALMKHYDIPPSMMYVEVPKERCLVCNSKDRVRLGGIIEYCMECGDLVNLEPNVIRGLDEII